jgi:exonuclease VII small subunit
MSELSRLVEWFEGDDFELEKAIERYEEVQKLAKEIEADLGNLKNEITVVAQKFDAE